MPIGRRLCSSRCVIALAGLLILAACAAPPSYVPYPNGAAGSTSDSDGYIIVHRFGGSPEDGSFPNGLILSGNVLYGTTMWGGAYGNQHRYIGGTIFSITLSGEERVLYNFGRASTSGSPLPDGIAILTGSIWFTAIDPGNAGALYRFVPGGTPIMQRAFASGSATPEFLDVQDAVMYGASPLGGPRKHGAIYRFTADGTATILHAFASEANGTIPMAYPVAANGALYGTTQTGGTYGGGTLYRVGSTGKESVLYDFGANATQGFWPESPLLYVAGKFYGTTGGGGAPFPHAQGTVFSVTRDGAHRVLFSFSDSAKQGAFPTGRLLLVNGKLYGTTRFGGAYNHGTVFSLSLDGSERVLHSFDRDTNANPGEMIYADGRLYGFAQGGPTGKGVIFSLSL